MLLKAFLSLNSFAQMRLMGECRGSIDAVKRAEGELTEDEDDPPGLTNLNGVDAQGSGQDFSLPPVFRRSGHPLVHVVRCCRVPPGVIERWELIQAQSLSEKHRHKQDLQQWQQLSSDLQNMRAWLGRSEAELGQLRGLVQSADIHTIQQRIKKLKVGIFTWIPSRENHFLSPRLFHFCFFYTFSIPLYFLLYILFVNNLTEFILFIFSVGLELCPFILLVCFAPCSLPVLHAPTTRWRFEPPSLVTSCRSC